MSNIVPSVLAKANWEFALDLITMLQSANSQYFLCQNMAESTLGDFNYCMPGQCITTNNCTDIGGSPANCFSIFNNSWENVGQPSLINSLTQIYNEYLGATQTLTANQQTFLGDLSVWLKPFLEGDFNSYINESKSTLNMDATGMTLLCSSGASAGMVDTLNKYITTNNLVFPSNATLP